MSEVNKELLQALKNLLTYANAYSDDMRKRGFGAEQLGHDASDDSVAGMARAAIAKAERQLPAKHTNTVGDYLAQM